MTRDEAIERVLNVFADRPSGPTGEDVLAALGIALDAPTTHKPRIHECRPQPNMCTHVAHNFEAPDYWVVVEVPALPPGCYGGTP